MLIYALIVTGIISPSIDTIVITILNVIITTTTIITIMIVVAIGIVVYDASSRWGRQRRCVCLKVPKVRWFHLLLLP